MVENLGSAMAVFALRLIASSSILHGSDCVATPENLRGQFRQISGEKKGWKHISFSASQNVGARGWRWGRPKPRAVPPRAKLRVSRDLPGAMCRLGLPRARWVRSEPRRFHSALGSTPDFIPSIPSFQALSSSRATGSLLPADGSNPRGAANPMKDDDLRPTKGTTSKNLLERKTPPDARLPNNRWRNWQCPNLQS